MINLNLSSQNQMQQSFVEEFEQTVNTFLFSNSLNERSTCEEKFSELLDYKRFIHNLVDVVYQTKQPNSLFMVSSVIENILKKYNEDIEIEYIQEIFEAISKRLKSIYLDNQVDDEMITNFYKCRVSLIKCISLIQIYFPSYFDQWHSFSIDDAKILFCFLFEEEERQFPDPSNKFFQKISSFPEEDLFRILNESEMTSEWLELFRFCVLKADKIDKCFKFLDKLNTIPDNSQLFPAFVTLFSESASISYYSLMDTDADFIECLCDIALKIIKVLLEPPINEVYVQMAGHLWNEILGYDDEFLIDREASFSQRALSFFVQTLNSISKFPEIFFNVTNSACYTIAYLVENSVTYTPITIQFLSFLINLLDESFLTYANNIISLAFYEISKISKQNNEIFSFFKEISKNPTLGICYAISSSTSNIKENFALSIFNFVMSSEVDELIIFYAQNCSKFIGQEIHQFTEFLLGFSTSQSTLKKGIAKAIASISENYPSLITDNYSNKICSILDISSLSPSNSNDMKCIIYLIKSLVYSIDYLGIANEQCNQIINSIYNGVSNVILNRRKSLDQESLQFAIKIVKNAKKMLPTYKNYELVHTFYIDLYNKLLEWINPDNVEDDNSTDILCTFFSYSLRAKIAQDLNYIMNWIGETLFMYPVPSHFTLLSKLIDLFPSDKILQYILQINDSDDNEMIFAVLSFIKVLASSEWPNFFNTFPVSLYINPLKSLDPRVASTALDIISNIVESPKCIQNLNLLLMKVIDGLFTNFEDVEMRKAINIIIKIITSDWMDSTAVVQYVTSIVPEKSAELHYFIEAITEKELDRVKILKTAQKLKSTLKN